MVSVMSMIYAIYPASFDKGLSYGSWLSQGLGYHQGLGSCGGVHNHFPGFEVIGFEMPNQFCGRTTSLFFIAGIQRVVVR